MTNNHGDPLARTPSESLPRLDRFPWLGLALVLLVFVALALVHSVIVPITQGEDELAHYRYLTFISQTGRLPANYDERQQAWYRADWPPLYHLLVGWAVSPLDTTRPHLKDVGESPRRRLVGQIFYPRLIIYTEDANRPWQDGILAWHIGRFISILFASGALVFTYLTALELAQNLGRFRPGTSPPIFATAVTALLAFTPRFVFTSAMLGDDSLFVLLSAWFIWLMLRALRGSDGWGVYALMGVLLGLSITTKYSTGLFPLLFLPLLWWRVRHAGRSWRWAAGRLTVAWGAVLLSVSWWFGWIAYYFNTVERDGWFFGLLSPLLASGPDVSMRRIFSFFGGGEFGGQIRPDAVAEGNFGGWLTYLFQTFWGVPVLEHDPLFPWAYLLVLAFCGLSLVGLWFFWRRAAARPRAEVGMLVLVVALLLPFPVLRFFLTYNILETGQGRHILYPAAQAIPILLLLGWLYFGEWTRERTVKASNSSFVIRHSSFVFAPAMFLLIWSVFQLTYMHRTYPDPLPVQSTTFNPQTIPQPLTHDFSDAIRLLGYDFQPDPEQAIINLTLYWQARRQVDENYRVRVQLIDSAGSARFTWISHPVNGLYPTRAWDAGDVVRDALPLPLAAVPAAPYQIQVDWLPEAENTPLADAPLQIIQFDLGQTQPIPAPANLTGDVEYRLWLNGEPVRQRQTVALSWRGDAGNNPDWTLVGPDGQSRPPAATGDATTVFVVQPDWPGGEYRLALNGAPADRLAFSVAAPERQFSLPPEVTTRSDWTPVEAVFARPDGTPQVKLIGYTLPERRAEPGGGLPLTLYWQSLAPVLGDYVVFDVPLDAQQVAHGGYDRLPREFYSTILWANGEVVEDGFAVPIAPDAPPGAYHIHVGLYSLATGAPVSLPLLAENGASQATSVVIGPVKVGGPPPDVIAQNPQPQVALNQSFGGEITLLGYNVNNEQLIMNNEQTTNSITNDQLPMTNEKSANSTNSTHSLTLTLYWRADTAPSADYTTFVHLRDATGQTVTQKDQPPAAGRYPTSLWDSGEVIADEIVLPLADVPPGQYTPVIGLYRFDTGARLPLDGGPETELPLKQISITNGE